MNSLKIFAAIDVETSGLDPGKHDILELALIPLKPDFTLSEIPDFTCRVKAVHPENADPEALRVNGLNLLEGVDLSVAALNFSAWLQENRIERIHPVGHNLDFDLRFLRAKFPVVSDVFSSHGRDTMKLALTINDLAQQQLGAPVFAGMGLAKLKAHFNLEDTGQHRAKADALATAALYRLLLAKLIVNS